jgi:hypothetical protein
VPPVSRIRVVDASVALWVVLWLLAGAYVFVAVGQLQDYGDTTITAAAGLHQTSRALGRAADGLRDTGDALEQIPFVGGEIESNIGRTAGDVDRLGNSVRVTARQARASGVQARESAHDVAIVLGAAVALVPTVPVIALYLLLRPVVIERVRR